MNRTNTARLFSSISPICPFTTENIAGYFPLLNLKGKNILVVAGSGDHILNAVYYGAKCIHAFDVNLLSKFYTEMKMAAVRSLSRAEFLEYFRLAADNSRVFSHLLYDQFSGELSAGARQAFDLFYRVFDGQGRALRMSRLFYNEPALDKNSEVFNSYLENSNRYLQTRRKLKNAEYRWLRGNISKPGNLVEPPIKYDNILLTRIADYAQRLYPGPDYLRKFADEIVRPLTGCLSEGGLICLAYLITGDVPSTKEPKNNFYLSEKRKEIFSFPGFDYQEIIFPGVMSGHQDTLVIIRKAV